MKIYRGYGVLDTAIDRLPFELHIPGYRFCGPGTKLRKRLARGDKGINYLDESCKEHDIVYDTYSDPRHRHEADQLLANRAFERVRSSDASIGEKLAALAVGSAMKAKVKLGMGRRTRRSRKAKRKTVFGKGRVRKGGAIPFRRFIRKAWDVLKNSRPTDLLRAARTALNKVKGIATDVISPRVIPVPKTGGFLPLIPLFAGLSALGALGGGAAGIAKAVKESQAAQEQLKEAQRHNEAMEAIALGKGLHIKPYKKGLGLYLTRPKKNFP